MVYRVQSTGCPEVVINKKKMAFGPQRLTTIASDHCLDAIRNSFSKHVKRFQLDKTEFGVLLLLRKAYTDTAKRSEKATPSDIAVRMEIMMICSILTNRSAAPAESGHIMHNPTLHRLCRMGLVLQARAGHITTLNPGKATTHIGVLFTLAHSLCCPRYQTLPSPSPIFLNPHQGIASSLDSSDAATALPKFSAWV